MFRCYSYTIIRKRINPYLLSSVRINALPEDGVTVTLKYVGAVSM